MRKIVNALLLLGFILSGPTLHHMYVKTYVGSSVVKLKYKRGGGTGFHVKARSGATYIVTNAHICNISKNNTLDVYYKEKKVQVSRIIKIYKKHDLCIVAPIKGVGGLRLSPFKPGILPVYIVGHPRLRPLSVQKGEVIATTIIKMLHRISAKRLPCPYEEKLVPKNTWEYLFGARYMCIRSYKTSHLNIISYPGNSGSPVVSPIGQVVGVLFAGSSRMLTDSYMVPLESLRDLLKGY